MKPVVLTFDLGTQSLRATIVDSAGTILYKEQTKFESLIFANPGWAEQDGSFYWQQLCIISKLLKEKSGKIWNEIKAVSIQLLEIV